MFYTSVNRQDNHIFVRGYKDNGKPFRENIIYSPFLFIKSNKESPYKTIYGESVDRLDFKNIYEAREFVKKYSDLPSYKIYGMREFEFPYIYNQFPRGFEYNTDLIKIIDIDIENDSEGGFANLEEADKEITAITLSNRGIKTITFGFKLWDDPDYIYCPDEISMLKKFLEVWRSPVWLPDILSGWNIKNFDVPYLVNRIKRVLGEDYLNLSPWGIVNPIRANTRDGRSFDTYNIFGIQIIDYLEVYKKFATGERENYTLNFIAQYELQESKTDYGQYGSLNKLYQENPALFYTYNRQDTKLISKFEKKLHYIEQIITVAYFSRVNFENIVRTVKTWDVLVHNYLMDRNIVVNPMPIEGDGEDEEQIIGGYVKEPTPGYYHWVCSLDFTSLYPSVAMMANISPDTFVVQLDKRPSLDLFLNGDTSALTEHLKKKDVTMTANACMFRRDKRGFLSAIMKELFDDRKKVKKEMLIKEEQLQNIVDGTPEFKRLRGEIRKLDNLQNALKLLNNSGYGAAANKYFRWFSNPLAEGITSTGQMISQYVANKLNIYLNEYFDTELDWVIYQDTDSAYINLKPYIDRLNENDKKKSLEMAVCFMQEKVRPEVARICDHICSTLNAFDNVIEMKFETACDKAIFIRKKRYILNILFKEGVYLAKEKMKVTGLETQRSSVPKVCREAMLECFKFIFKEDKDGLIKYIYDFKKKFMKMSFLEVGKPTSVKGLGKYFDEGLLYRKATPIHVKGSLIYNSLLEKMGLDKKYEKIYDHDKVKYTYLKSENPTRERVISIKGDPPPELEIDKYIDYNIQWEKNFIEPMNHVCEAIGWQVEETADLNKLF